jgi:hypothetical protein
VNRPSNNFRFSLRIHCADLIFDHITELED